MSERVSTGVEGLDEVTGGGFPAGSLVLLAGNPGTGKSVFSIQFLVAGALSGEPGVYASFADEKGAFIDNFSRHLAVDLKRLEDERRIKILDLATVSEEAVSVTLQVILSEVERLKARRLVIDSFTGMAQAFEKPIDARMVLHTIFGKIVRKMECTTIMVSEIPTGRPGTGFGLEEFVADGVMMLKRTRLDGRLLRELEITKMRGTRLAEDELVFTLEHGFKAREPFKFRPIEKPQRFQATVDSDTHFSSGIPDLDRLLDGGYPKGATVLVEMSEKVSTPEYHLLLAPTAVNFVAQERPAMIIPAAGVDAELDRRVASAYGLTEDEIARLAKIFELPTPGKDQVKPYIMVVEGKDVETDFQKWTTTQMQLIRDTGKPAFVSAALDTLASIYGGKDAARIISLEATKIRSLGGLAFLIAKSGYRRLRERLKGVSDIHLRFTREHGVLMIYGVRPRTPLYMVEADMSKGYPVPGLTRIS